MQIYFNLVQHAKIIKICEIELPNSKGSSTQARSETFACVVHKGPRLPTNKIKCEVFQGYLFK